MTANTQKAMGIRLEESILQAIDKKRMQLAQQTGQIPTRSDIVRLALLEFLADAYVPVTRK